MTKKYAIKLLSILTFIIAAFAIYYEQQENIKMYAIFKVLTTLTIIVLSIVVYFKYPSTYSFIMIIALVFCLLGDILLIGSNYFIYGLLAFLIAHIAFTISFTSISGFRWHSLPLITLLLIGGLYYSFLSNGLNNYTIPVAIYFMVIIIMNWQAIALLISKQSGVFLALAIASLLFSFSDAIIAYDKFVNAFYVADMLILSTYWLSIFTFTISGMYIKKNLINKL